MLESFFGCVPGALACCAAGAVRFSACVQASVACDSANATVVRLLQLLNTTKTEGYKVGPVRKVAFPAGLTVAETPANELRGHQLGYRPKTNSYVCACLQCRHAGVITWRGWRESRRGGKCCAHPTNTPLPTLPASGCWPQDGWSVAEYEQYIIDLAIFGTNMIELIPWKTDDVVRRVARACGALRWLGGCLVAKRHAFANAHQGRKWCWLNH